MIQCSCGNDHKKMMKHIGGRRTALLIVKHHKLLGKGFFSKMSKKTFKTIGDAGVKILIEIAIRILGEPFRKEITLLIGHYGVDALKYIEKYSSKGIGYIIKKLSLKNKKKGGCIDCIH